MWLYCGLCSDGIMGNCLCNCPSCSRPPDRVTLSSVDYLPMTRYFATCIRSLRVALGAGPVGHACGCHASDGEGHCLKTLAFYSGVRQLRLAIHTICASDRFMLSDTAGTPCVLGTIMTPSKCHATVCQIDFATLSTFTAHPVASNCAHTRDASIQHSGNSHTSYQQPAPDLAYATSGVTLSFQPVDEPQVSDYFQPNSFLYSLFAVSYTHLTLPTKRIV